MRDSELLALCELRAEEILESAQALRAQRPVPITYSPKVFIPLTMLCRDVCHYCTFAKPPRKGERAYMRADEVLAVASAGAEAGCHEALFTLGDKPERRYKAARDELSELGHETTVDYLVEMCRLVLEETGLLPHANPGVLDRDELGRLREVTASQGIMLETASDRLSEKGLPHYGSPDKVPARRIDTIELAGELRIPFTTGILIGIGETRQERIEALLVIRDLHQRHGHIQEVIVQNFRAKPETKMADHPEPPLDELLWTAAAARCVLGAEMNIQCPPNLSYDEFPRLLDAGINDWGGVSPVTIDHVNPEAPWPEIERLSNATLDRWLDPAPRLPIYPEYVNDVSSWCAPSVAAAVLRRADATGLAREGNWAAGANESRNGCGTLGPRHLQLASRNGNAARSLHGESKLDPSISEALTKVDEEEELEESDITALFLARGPGLEAVFDAADRLRKDVCGDTVSYVVTRNINYTNVCYFRCGFCAFSKGKLAENLRGPAYLVPTEEILRRCHEAWDRGAVEVCLQGGIHPGFTGEYYTELCDAIKRELPELHIHAFSALEVWQGAATLGIPLDDYLRRLHSVGLASLPGTAAEVLDDDVRQIICPDKVTTAQWLEVHDTAHRVGLRSTTTIMYGSVEGPRSWARHLIAIRDQQKRSGGFSEFVPLPFVHMEAPIFLQGRARPGPTLREAVLMHAVGRLALHPHITNIQTSWVKMGVEGALLALNAGANDLGGTLMNESISRAAGASHGQEMAPEQMEMTIRRAGRISRQRTTLYGSPDVERTRRSFGAAPLEVPQNPKVDDSRLKKPRELVRPGLTVG